MTLSNTYKVRYEGGYEESYSTFAEALETYKSWKDAEGYYHAVELYRVSEYGLCKTLRGTSYN